MSICPKSLGGILQIHFIALFPLVIVQSVSGVSEGVSNLPRYTPLIGVSDTMYQQPLAPAAASADTVVT